MRMLLLLLLYSCTSLTFGPRPEQRTIASGRAVVDRLELELQQTEIFVSGMDSTYLKVKLYGSDGKLLRNINPEELGISSSEDLDAKPFSNKHGTYWAEVLPRFMSPEMRLQVIWNGRVLSNEVSLAPSRAPLRDKLDPAHQVSNETKINGVISMIVESKRPQTITEGFFFRNLGVNRIIKARGYPMAERLFQFEYPEQARQNIALLVDDLPNGIGSHTMHSLFMFFPRKYLPTIEQDDVHLRVTLPTGEKVLFSKESKEVLEGVLQEGPIDMSEVRFTRQYADLRYRGRGVVLRANARGQSPQLGQYETNRIDDEFGLRGSVDVLIINGTTGQKCRRPKSDFWEQLDVTPIEFKFATDEDFDVYLRINCGFGLPRF
jgi:hypothetical protein